jgi:hypothetical protein
MSASLPEKDVADEGAEHLVYPPEKRTDDDNGDDNDNRALDHLSTIRPVDLEKLGPRLAEEAAAPPGLVLDRCDRRAADRSWLRYAAGLARRLLTGRTARIAPLPAGLVGHL